MKLLIILPYLLPMLVVVSMIGFVVSIVLFFKNGRKTIPFISLSIFVSPIILIALVKLSMASVIAAMLEDESVKVSVAPELESSARDFMLGVMSNLSSSKGMSGSHPTSSKFIVNVCELSDCFIVEVAKDSRDKGTYWVSYLPLKGFRVPLGFARLGAEI